MEGVFEDLGRKRGRDRTDGGAEQGTATHTQSKRVSKGKVKGKDLP